MSRDDNHGLTDNHRQRSERRDFPLERGGELPPLGLSREAAMAEMERFRGIAEYETRKIFGQRSPLKQPVEIGPPSRAARKKSAPRKSQGERPGPAGRTEGGREQAAAAEAVGGRPRQAAPLQAELDLGDAGEG